MITDLAFVLCAGLGTRLRPLTLATPKPLIPIWNRPLLAHTLTTLESWGVREVYLNTHWLADAVEAFAAAYRGPLHLHLLPEPDILGTGGALRNLAPHLNGRPFWLVNGDILFNVRPAALEDAFVRSGHFAAAWLEPMHGPRTVEMDYAGRITCWHSPTPKVEHTYTFTGVSLLSAEVLRYLPKKQSACALTDLFEGALAEGRFVQGALDPKAYWNDAGTAERYAQAHRDTRDRPDLAHYRAGAADPQPEAVCRALERLNWPAEETAVIPLGRRGSSRTFWRLLRGKKAVMVIAYETEGRAENARYAACAKALHRAHVAVPAVLADEPGLLLMEDLGDQTLTPALVDALDAQDARARFAQGLGHEPESPADAGSEAAHEPCACCGHTHAHPPAAEDACGQKAPPSRALSETMALLAAFHRADVGNLELEPPFDAALYAWERELYERFAGALSPAAKAEWEHVRDYLLAEPSVLLHRDFQSTNILWHAHHPAVIDFQGMRRGAAVYDLASFLYDPYESWSSAHIECALTAYAQASGSDLAHLRKGLPYAGIQRLMQAIGAYHRLASVGQTRFLAFAPVAQARAAACAETLGLNALANALKPGS